MQRRAQDLDRGGLGSSKPRSQVRRRERLRA
jgi:hypothetical protein